MTYYLMTVTEMPNGFEYMDHDDGFSDTVVYSIVNGEELAVGEAQLNRIITSYCEKNGLKEKTGIEKILLSVENDSKLRFCVLLAKGGRQRMVCGTFKMSVIEDENGISEICIMPVEVSLGRLPLPLTAVMKRIENELSSDQNGITKCENGNIFIDVRSFGEYIDGIDASDGVVTMHPCKIVEVIARKIGDEYGMPQDSALWQQVVSYAQKYAEQNLTAVEDIENCIEQIGELSGTLLGEDGASRLKEKIHREFGFLLQIVK